MNSQKPPDDARVFCRQHVRAAKHVERPERNVACMADRRRHHIKARREPRWRFLSALTGIWLFLQNRPGPIAACLADRAGQERRPMLRPTAILPKGQHNVSMCGGEGAFCAKSPTLNRSESSSPTRAFSVGGELNSLPSSSVIAAMGSFIPHGYFRFWAGGVGRNRPSSSQDEGRGCQCRTQY